MSEIGIGIIGTGFMGQSHALAYRAAGGIFRYNAAPFSKWSQTIMRRRAL